MLSKEESQFQTQLLGAGRIEDVSSHLVSWLQKLQWAGRIVSVLFSPCFVEAKPGLRNSIGRMALIPQLTGAK